MKRVLISISRGLPSGNARIDGLFRYLTQEGRSWLPQFVPTPFTPTHRDRFLQLARAADGILIDVFGCLRLNDLPADVPLVRFDPEDEDETQSPRRGNVCCDGDVIGRMAAHFFASCGLFRGFGYVPALPGVNWDEARRTAFCAELSAREADVSVYSAKDALPDWLRALPKPAAVFGANDEAAFRTLAACRAARLPVPQKVAVLGADNDALFCENATPALSSIGIDFFNEGVQSGRLLARLMRGPVPKGERTVVCKKAQVFHRLSTPSTSSSGLLVQKAAAFIARHALEGISVDDVVRHLGVSRRLADLRFRELRGETMLTAIRRLRLDEVRRRLVETDDSLEIISRTCGFGAANHLRAAFESAFGIPLAAYRKRFRPQA